MNWKNELILLGYLVFFAASMAALLWWQKRQRKRRLPFPDDLKLLRAPGESLHRKVLKLEEDFLQWLLGAACVPLAVLVMLLNVTIRMPPVLQLAGVAMTLLAVAAAFWASVRWLTPKVFEISNHHLGYFGERLVAEYLEPLKAQGWWIFHDVPGSANGKKFNLDHVAVGPAGVYVIETKTRRKGGARPGFDDYKVYFDGRSLVWPWGEDNHGLEQAERNAVWLMQTLQTEIGERVVVTPILTLPGWWVEMKPSRDSRLCRVTNPKNLSQLLPGAPVLRSEQITLIAARLEARCRDVEY